jgi:hypothetical protein
LGKGVTRLSPFFDCRQTVFQIPTALILRNLSCQGSINMAASIGCQRQVEWGQGFSLLHHSLTGYTIQFVFD